MPLKETLSSLSLKETLSSLESKLVLLRQDYNRQESPGKIDSAIDRIEELLNQADTAQFFDRLLTKLRSEIQPHHVGTGIVTGSFFEFEQRIARGRIDKRVVRAIVEAWNGQQTPVVPRLFPTAELVANLRSAHKLYREKLRALAQNKDARIRKRLLSAVKRPLDAMLMVVTNGPECFAAVQRPEPIHSACLGFFAFSWSVSRISAI